jgi:hypothetical protein
MFADALQASIELEDMRREMAYVANFERRLQRSVDERNLVGRIVLHRAHELVIEIDLHEPLQWQPGDTAALALSNGRMCPAELDTSRTTAAGEGKPGQTLRVTLVSEEAFPAEALREIWLECAGLLLRIRFEA